ncbi:hypothetical protein [Methylophaga sp. OBS4]|uniref:hypothetical protein n=1 Tax=Methylophaga sp. OBS4 TaxID=2991935 RepID=UPI00225614F6|nr:hypothetical protein [Methylophaga sp. OBS4]MCX4187157.1 hypothetical protein [Methylophaga sp. OBS4]
MTWQPVDLETPAADASSLNLPITIETITPWTHGAKEGTGAHTWLSFPNAVAALVKRIQANPVQAIFVLGLTAANYKDLAEQCQVMAAAFPLKQIQQWQRHAAKLVNLEQEKRNLIDAVASTTALQLNAVPTAKARMEKALAQQAKSAAAALSGADPMADLDSFATEKAAFDAATDDPLPALSGGTGWRFYADSDITNKIQTGHPGHQYTYTVLMAFMGSAADLAYLNEMMPESV